MARLLIPAGFAGLGLLLSMPAHAQADPLRPPAAFVAGSGRVEAPHLVLQSILLAGAHRQAIINGRTLSPGQSVEGYQLLSLDAQRAHLAGPQGRLTLHINPVQIQFRPGSPRPAPHFPADRHP